jgi:hypothetical protein
VPRIRWVFILLLLAGAAAASAVFAFAGSGLDHPGVIRITNRELGRESVDLGVPGRSAADVLVLTQFLYNRHITPKPIGHEEAMCTYLGRGGILGDGSRQCNITFYLPRGRLFVSGTVHSLLFYSLPVVGGTGIYDNVRGTLTVTFLRSGPTRQLLFFRLTV